MFKKLKDCFCGGASRIYPRSKVIYVKTAGLKKKLIYKNATIGHLKT